MHTSRSAAPFISLSMIVKDEERFIEQSIVSASSLVDEVVVYDTGSTDRTIELARGLGATVLEGHWDDDFARARNESLRACSGTWVLCLDADEVIEANPDRVRQVLRDRSTVDGVQLRIENVGAHGGDFTHDSIRFFRRSRMHWVGRVHEHVTRRDGEEPRVARLERARILHYGYTAELALERGKIERNLRIAREAVAGDHDANTPGKRHLDLARSAATADRDDEAVEHCARAAELATGALRLLALRLGTEVLTDAGRHAEARDWQARYADETPNPRMATFLLGSIDLLELGDGRHLASLEAGDALDDGTGISPSEMLVRRRIAGGLTACERWGDAAATLRPLVEADAASEVLPELVEAMLRAGDDVDALVGGWSADDARVAVPRASTAEPTVREALTLAVVRRFGMDSPPAAALVLAHARACSSVDDVVPWASLLRASALTLPCPVLERAEDPTRPPTDRFLAAATAHAAFRDPRALALLFEISEQLRPEDEADAAYILQEIAPDLLTSSG